MRALILAGLGLLMSLPSPADPVRFSLHAPEARSVELAGEMTDWATNKRAMRREADGRWSLSLDLPPGQWLYKFIVDGERWIADPSHADRDADGQGGEHSFVFVGAGDWQTPPPGTPRGRVETHRLPSAAWGKPMAVQLYLPPGWQRGTPLPVLWLLHGRGMSPDQWTRTGRIAHYLDNLLARGAIRPMAVVLPSSEDVWYEGKSRQHIAEELPAWLEAQTGLKTERARSALAGMSMGGAGALRLGLEAPQRFGFAYALSGAFRPDLLAQLKPLKTLPLPLVLRTGSEDPVTPSNHALRALLAERGIAVDYRETPGGHSWIYWSHQIAPMLVALNRHFHPAE